MFSQSWLFKRRGVGAVAASLAIAAVAAGCGSSSSSSSSSSGGSTSAPTSSTSASTGTSTSGSSSSASSSGGKTSIGYVLAGPVSALMAIGQGIQKDAKAQGMSYQEVSADFQPDQQIAAMQALEAKHVNVIISAPLDSDAFFQAAKTAESKGIKVLTYNAPDQYASYSITNPDTQGASNVVQALAKEIKAKGKSCDIGIIEGQPSTATLERRNKGLLAGAKAAGCTVLATQVATETTATEGSSIADTWKARFGSKMTGIAVINDDVALGVLPAATGDFSPLVVSMNGEPAAVQAVQQGTMYEDGGLENAIMGISLGQASYDLTHGKSSMVPRVAVSPYYTITKATASDFNKTFADATVLKASGGTTSWTKKGGQTVLNYKP